MVLVDPATAVSVEFQKEGILPDIVPQGFQPSALLLVKWENKETMLGNTLTLEDTSNEPEVLIFPSESEDSNSRYTLTMLDPDAPSAQDPKYGPFRHWVISGLTNSRKPDVASYPSMEFTSDQVITPYRPPGPGRGTGTHKYVFLLFQEPLDGIQVPQNATERGTALEQRRSWSVTEFAERNGLRLVGANYFKLHAES